MRYFRDKLAMRMRALDRGIRVPDFVPVFNHGDIRYYLDHVPGPWVLKPGRKPPRSGSRRCIAPKSCGRCSNNWATSNLLFCWKSSFRARSITWIR